MPRLHGINLKHQRLREKPRIGDDRQKQENSSAAEMDFDFALTSSPKPAVLHERNQNDSRDGDSVPYIQPVNSVQPTHSILPTNRRRYKKKKADTAPPQPSSPRLDEASSARLQDFSEYETPIEFQELSVSDPSSLDGTTSDTLQESRLPRLVPGVSSSDSSMAPPAASSSLIELPEPPFLNSFHTTSQLPHFTVMLVKFMEALPSSDKPVLKWDADQPFKVLLTLPPAEKEKWNEALEIIRTFLQFNGGMYTLLFCIFHFCPSHGLILSCYPIAVTQYKTFTRYLCKYGWTCQNRPGRGYLYNVWNHHGGNTN
jgi:hypothetical protein